MTEYLIIIGVLGFLLGFLFGVKQTSKSKKAGYKKPNSDITKEYENFLSYDGTEQF